MAEVSSDETYTSFLGTGWSFPPEFVLGAGEVRMTSDEEDIAASLKILLGTSLGERFLQPKYGLNMNELVFEPINTTLLALLKDRAKRTVLVYEPRINLLSVEMDQSAQYEGKISLILEYEIRTTNSRYNLVYPFYTTDSSEVKREIPTIPQETV
jgi:phage baseplate assembly protein W